MVRRAVVLGLLLLAACVAPVAAQEHAPVPRMPGPAQSPFYRAAGLDGAWLVVGQPGLTHPSWRVALERTAVEAAAVYDDVYRYRGRSSDRSVTAGQGRTSVGLLGPVRWRTYRGYGALRLGYRAADGEGREPDAVDVEEVRQRAPWARVEGVLRRGRHHVAANLHAHRVRSEAAWQVLAYPEDADPRINALLFDLLPATFGHNQRLEGRTYGLEGGVAYQHEVRQGLALGATVQGGWADGLHTLHYVNQRQAALGGPRQAPLHAEARSLSPALTIVLSPAETVDAALHVGLLGRHVEARLRMQDVPQADGRLLDVVELGHLEARQRGWHAGLLLRWHLRPTMTLGGALRGQRSHLRGDGTLSTPVLGYVGGTQLPIVHRFEGAWRSVVRLYDLRARWRHQPGQRLGYRVEAGWMRPLPDAAVLGDALLGFGIDTAPLDARLAPDIHLFDLDIAVDGRLTPGLLVRVTVRQVVPYVADQDADGGSEKAMIRGGTTVGLAVRTEI